MAMKAAGRDRDRGIMSWDSPPASFLLWLKDARRRRERARRRQEWREEYERKEILRKMGERARSPVSPGRLATQRGAVASYAGLLHLRSDRADRTLQWAGALTGEQGGMFDSLYLIGGHSRALARRIRKANVLVSDDPREIMRSIGSQLQAGAVIFGFGNIGGIGVRIVEHWNQEGEPSGT